jgi:hypothetical protein
MPGVGKLLKEAAKMQKRIEQLQNDLSAKEFEVSSGGGAIQIKVNGQGRFLGLKIDPEFLKEDSTTVQEALLSAFQEAADRAKSAHEEAMRSATSGFSMPGMM